MANQTIGVRVEISGWDLSERFFVERGALRDEDDEQKRVTIRRPVRVGGLLFLRLLDYSHPSTTFPVAFRVREVREEKRSGKFEVTLRQMWPKPGAMVPGVPRYAEATRPEWLGMK